jgi:hypothetical protein
MGTSGTATTGQIVGSDAVLWNRPEADSYPLLFAQNEGFIIRATVPATGTWAFAVTVDWNEQVIGNY